MKEREPIDFVIAWVDGNDPEWQRRKNDAQHFGGQNDARRERYRDWGLLRYWFRAVAQFTPWVRKVHFVCDQKPPEWLNTDCKKLHITYHKDYIPHEFLPTFNSHPIELNAHRIPGLSEHFVYFCDDMFLLRPVKETAFFRGGLPADCAGLNPIPCSDLRPESKDKRIFYIPLNDTEYLNREFNFRQCVKRHPLKWYNIRYGNYLIRNVFFSSYSRFVGFSVFHLAQPYLRKAFEEAWESNEDILRQTCSHPFRDDHDVSQSFIRFRQLAEGNFSPKHPVSHGAFHICEDNRRVVDIIKNQRLPMICLNDGEFPEEQFERIRSEIQNAFESILSDRSEYER